MNFLNKLFGAKAKTHSIEDDDVDIVILPGPGRFSLEVVGESYYQENLEAICGPRKERGENRVVEVTLILDNNNPYDNKAVRVEVEGKKVGHLSREVARKYRDAIKQGGHPNAIGKCQAKIKGGWERKNGERGNYGIWLDIPVEYV